MNAVLICSKCKQTFDSIESFPLFKQSSGRPYRRRQCVDCYSKMMSKYKRVGRKHMPPEKVVNKTKTCIDCKKTFDSLPQHYYKNTDTVYYYTQCPDCRRVYFTANYNKRKDAYRPSQIKYKYSPKGIYNQLKYRQATISQEDFIEWHDQQPKKCSYCDIPEEQIYIHVYKGWRPSNRLAIDKRDPDKGYSKGNLALSCVICNSLKSNILTPEEMSEIGQRYIKPKWKAALKLKVP